MNKSLSPTDQNAESNNVLLILNNIDKRHESQYRCEADNGYGNTSIDINVSVLSHHSYVDQYEYQKNSSYTLSCLTQVC